MVGFRLFINMVAGQEYSKGDVVSDLFQLSFGAILLGLGWAIAVIFLLGRVQGDATVESTLPIAMAYLLFWLAEKVRLNVPRRALFLLVVVISHVNARHLQQAHVSGVLAVVFFGLCFPWFGMNPTPSLIVPASLCLTSICMACGHKNSSSMLGQMWCRKIEVYSRHDCAH